MEKRLFIASGAFLAAVAFLSYSGPAGGRPALEAVLAETVPAESPSGPGILKAARELLDELGAKEREKALLDHADAERFNWHFIPRERKGVPLKELDEARRERVKALLRSSLSEAGFKKAEGVRGLEDVLREIEGPEARFRRDPLLYYVSFFGAPSEKGRWGWRFEGHHLSLNFSLDGSELISATPLVFGANPATVREGPMKGLRVLGMLEDMARELVQSLDEKQLQACLGKKDSGKEEVPEEVPDTQRARYRGPFPAGITAGDFKPEQREKLEKLLFEYRLSFPEAMRAALEKEMRARPESIHFAWGGSLKPSEPHSYLIHGPTFVINYANVQNGGNHIHSAFRTLKADFALGDESGR